MKQRIRFSGLCCWTSALLLVGVAGEAGAQNDLREHYSFLERLLPGYVPLRVVGPDDPIDKAPTNVDEIERLAQRLYDPAWDKNRRQDGKWHRYQGRAGVGGCEEIGHARLYRGLLKLAERSPERAEDIDGRISGILEEQLGAERLCSYGEPGRFEIRYVPANGCPEASAEESDAEFAGMLDKVQEALVEVSDHLCATFRCPEGPVPVVVADMWEGVWGATSPAGPIHLNRVKLEEWARNSESDDRIRATVAHEFFHKIEYTYGFRTRWLGKDGRDPSWFSEGLAGWAEVYVLRNRVYDESRCSRAAVPALTWNFWKHEAVLSKPGLPIWERDYDALPLWVEVTRDGSGQRGEIAMRDDSGEPGRNAMRCDPDDPEIAMRADLIESMMDSVVAESGPKAAFDEIAGWGAGRYLPFAKDLLHSGLPARQPTRLDPSRRYLRPYTIRVSCENREWEHTGTIQGMAAAYFRFLASEPDDGLSVKIDFGPGHRSRFLAWASEPRKKDFDFTDVTVVGLKAGPTSYSLTATVEGCEEQDSPEE
jgi:hypothetical protein